MNQKLRTARGALVILFAILCIVCLSLSLVFSSQFAAFADESGATVTLPDVSPVDGSHLWLMHYEGGPAEGEPLWDGIHNGEAIHYLDVNDDLDGGFGVCTGTAEQKNFFAPYRGVELSIKLNPQYKLADGTTLADKYDLSEENVHYDGAVNVPGDSSGSINAKTTVTIGGSEPFTCAKDWKIAALCNTIDIKGDYIGGERAYAQGASYADVIPAMSADVVYHFNSELIDIIVAVRHESGTVSYWQVSQSGAGYDVLEYPYEIDGVSAEIISQEGNLINYIIRTLDAGSYTLKITALAPELGEDEICYVAGGYTYKFNVVPQDISDSSTFERLFGTPIISENVVDYTGDSTWVPAVQLKIGNIVLRQGTDYTVQGTSNDVGWVGLQILGSGNLIGQYTIANAVRIMPADNDWDDLPNINPWSYGDYKADFNMIVGMPKFYADINDINFRITKVDADGNDIDIEGLSNIHYIRVEGDEDKFTVSAAVSEALSKLEVGQYRLYASVSGADNFGSNKNYKPLAEKSVTFYIDMGSNNWGVDSVPTIVSWTAGKYNPEVNTIKAIDRFNNEAIVIIRNGKGEIVYSNHPDHKNQEFGVYGKDANEVAGILKKLKAGYYTLQAEVKGTANYNGLSTLIDFSVARNGLPAWAVALIIIGSLGVVALIFGILHQKGVLQMLTGKVIVSMRTRANVDATLAAIRAAKVAREAEASIAAAKARDAEEAAKAGQKNEDK